MIGGALAKFLQASSERFILADLWEDEPEKGRIHLNLASAPFEWQLPDGIKTVYICAGITGLEKCRKDPTGTSRINVENTICLAESMMRKGTFVVFLSTSQVFDGSIPTVPAHTPLNPKSEYGRQKAAVETYLNQWPEQAAIVRLTKVVGPDSIFSEWAQSLFKDQPIRPFTDMVVSPIPLMTVISTLRLVGDQRLGGIWQISGDHDICYYDAAMKCGKAFGVDLNLIQPFTTGAAGLRLEVNPANTTMATERLRKELGIASPPILWTLSQAFAQ